ncbi:TolC family protein [Synechococcus sp. RSCCF101]|uniref:TolC family protein n=1 Tax=Synechococcus sp. RSCCF101 TaxID=2511069 RepID=UPI001245F7FC|nr:TolC family protein [Synechococcus sp. RSCCF101]QEY31150.1 TolC family protein [Synechococcus sp. RSCCF101]
MFWATLLSAAGAAAVMAAEGPGSSRELLERRWRTLDSQLEELDQLLPAAPAVQPDPLREPGLRPWPGGLLQPNRPASAPLRPDEAVPAPALSLPGPEALERPVVRSLDLTQALSLAFANSAALQVQREEVAAQAAEVASASGRYWPRLSLAADAALLRRNPSLSASEANNDLGFGPLFDPELPIRPEATTAAIPGPFYVPAGGGVRFRETQSRFEAALQLDYDLVDFARTPRLRAARARLERSRQTYALSLRGLQLDVSEAFYALQRADQLVRLRQAVLRNDMVILADVLELERAGLVPRVDRLRRSAIEAADEERLIQALADRAVARRRLATTLNLPPDVIPTAAGPITLQSPWPLDLEASLLAAYENNPELEAVLATRRALALEQDVVAADTLPRLSLFAAAGVSGSSVANDDFEVEGGGCCGSSISPRLNRSSTDWSMGVAIHWLLFDAGRTANRAESLARREAAAGQRYAARRNALRLRLEQAFFEHQASLARVAAARRGVGASLEAFRDMSLRYRSGLSSEVDLSITQERLVSAIVQRLEATVSGNITYARLLRELLPVPRDPGALIEPTLELMGPSGAGAGPG